jgi:hypothetical protein
MAFPTPGEMGGLDVELTLLLNRRLAEDPKWRDLADTIVLDLDSRSQADWVRGDQREVPRAAARAGVDLVHSLASTAPAYGHFRRVVTVHTWERTARAPVDVHERTASGR